MTNRGFQAAEIKPTDYILGGAVSLKGAALVPDGQWDKWLPAPEDQSRDGFEPYACVSYAILNAVEILMRQEFGEAQNLSDRFLAYATGTEAKKGNDPTTVCTFLGKKGDVHESDWPYPTPATDFYKTPPQNLYTLALAFVAEFGFDNQWVPATPEKMKDALTRSPLTVAGFAWAQDANELFYWPPGEYADHYFVIFGYEDGIAWHAFDSYANEYKRVAWDYPFIQVKEYTLHKNVVKPSAFALFVQWLREALGLQGTSFGAARSPQWSAVRNEFIRNNPTCAACGTTKKLQAHHVVAYHTDKAKELDPSNLIALCEGMERNCHRFIGHLDNFQSINENSREDAAAWLKRIQNRPKWNGLEWVYPEGYVPNKPHG